MPPESMARVLTLAPAKFASRVLFAVTLSRLRSAVDGFAAYIKAEGRDFRRDETLAAKPPNVFSQGTRTRPNQGESGRRMV